MSRSYAFLLLLLFTVGIYVFVFLLEERVGDELVVAFLDVGQGDAIFVESPTGVQLLIDGGQGSAVLKRLAEHMSFTDRTIDYVLATHMDADHIGGLVDVLERYEVKTIIHTEQKGESAVAKTFKKAVTAEGAERMYARRGMTFDLGGGVWFYILFPNYDPRDFESNTASIITQLVYGEHEFLLTGDAPLGIEEYLTSLDGKKLESDVLKVGHHGSKTSTASDFLEVVAPTYAIISAGKDNRYGHPHEEVMERLLTSGVITKNTAEDGSVVFVSDGIGLSLQE